MKSASTLRRFLILFVTLGVLVLSGLVLHGRVELELLKTRQLAEERLGVDLGAGAVGGRVDAIVRDVLYLAASRELRHVLEDSGAAAITDLQVEWSAFSRSKGVYDQLRWIDETGLERVRVDRRNGEAVIVPRDQLQNKGRRYFFTDTMALASGELYLSPLDLNIEHGAVEVPHKPMLRVATPVADSGGQPRGIVIANYLGSELIDAFRSASSISDHLMLLNRDGYWLVGSDREDEWGFMLERPEQTLARRAPEVWREIAAADAGQLENGDGLWTWRSVFPLRLGQRSSTGAAAAAQPSQAPLAGHDYVWKVVSFVPAARRDAVAVAARVRLYSVGVLLLLLIAWSSWKSVQTRATRHAAREALRDANVRLEATVAERTRELSQRVGELDRANERLEETDQILRVILATTLDGYIHVDREGRFLNVNDTFCRQSGYPRETLLALGLADVEACEDAAAVRRHIGQVIATGHAQFESRHRRRDGSVWDVEVSAVFHDGGPGTLHAFIRDISDRKTVEAALRESEARFRDIQRVCRLDLGGRRTLSLPLRFAECQFLARLYPRRTDREDAL